MVTLRLDAPRAVRVDVVDAWGRTVAEIAAGTAPAGETVYRRAAGDLAAGTYVVRVSAGGAVVTRPLSVVR